MSTLAEDEAEVFVTDHALERWDTRTDPTSISPEAAWQRAQRVSGPEMEMGGDEARVYVPEGVLLLRVAHSIVTVVSEREMQDRVRRHVAPLLNGI